MACHGDRSTDSISPGRCGSCKPSLEKTLESPLVKKEIKPVSPKGNQPWIFIGRTDAESPIFWPPDVKRVNSLEKTLLVRAGGKGGDREWDGWMALLTQWTGVWANSRRWWRTGKSGMLQSMGLQSRRTQQLKTAIGAYRLQDWVTSGQTTKEGEHSPTHQLTIGLKFYWVSPYRLEDITNLSTATQVRVEHGIQSICF